MKEKGFNIDDPEHKIVVCGDLFDRGTQAKRVQAFVMKLLRKNKIILIRGNHEDLAKEMIDNYAKYMFDIKNTAHWVNGTFQTMLDLTGMSFNDATTCLLEFKKMRVRDGLYQTHSAKNEELLRNGALRFRTRVDSSKTVALRV